MVEYPQCRAQGCSVAGERQPGSTKLDPPRLPPLGFLTRGDRKGGDQLRVSFLKKFLPDFVLLASVDWQRACASNLRGWWAARVADLALTGTWPAPPEPRIRSGLVSPSSRSSFEYGGVARSPCLRKPEISCATAAGPLDDGRVGLASGLSSVTGPGPAQFISCCGPA